MSSIIQTSADLYSVSITQWSVIQSLSNSLATTSVIHWAEISSVSASLNTLSQTVDALSTDVNSLLALASGLATVSSAIASVSSAVAALSSSVAATSSVQWAAISNLSSSMQTTSVQQWAQILNVSQQITYASKSIATLSGIVNTTSIVHWTAISSVSNTTYATSVAQWTALQSLSGSLDTTSVQQWAAIQSVLPSVVGQTGKYLQATPTGTQWTSLGGGGGGGGGGGYTTTSTALSVYTASVPVGDTVVVLQHSNAATISVVLPSSLSDGQTFVLKKGPSALSTAIIRVTAAGGTLIDGVSTPASVKAVQGFVAVTYSDKISAYVTTGQKWTDGGGIDPSVPFTFSNRFSKLTNGSLGQITSYYGSLSGTLGITFNGISAASFSVTNASTMNATPGPSSQPGIGDITIYDSIGVSRSITNYFEYRPYSDANGVQLQYAAVQVTVAENGTGYFFSDYFGGVFYKMTGKGASGANLNFGTAPSLSLLPHGPPLCERLSGQVVLLPYTNAGENYRYSTDGGSTFLSSSGITGALRFAVSPNGTYVLATKQGGGLWSGTNILTGNIAFSQSPSFSTITAQDICVNDVGAAVAVATNMSVFRSTDGGATWSQPVGAPSADFTACAIGANYAFVCGRFSGVFRSTDSGASWAAIAGLSTDAVFTSIACSQTGRYVVIGSNKRNIFVSHDYGVTFRETLILQASSITSIGLATDGNYVLLGGGNGFGYLYLI